MAFDERLRVGLQPSLHPDRRRRLGLRRRPGLRPGRLAGGRHHGRTHSRLSRARRLRLQGRALRRRHRRRQPVHAAPAAQALGRGQGLPGLWPADAAGQWPAGSRPAGDAAQVHQPDRRPDHQRSERKLPDPQRLDPRSRRREATGLPVDSRRWLFHRLGLLALVRRGQSVPQAGRGGGDHQPPAQRLRLLRSFPLSRPLRRKRRRGHAGLCAGHAVGPGQHRAVRRRPGPGDDPRPVGRRAQDLDPPGHAAGAGAVQPRRRPLRLGAS